MERKDMSEGPTTDWQTVINSVQYNSMKKLMALVDTKSFDTIEEFSKLAEYFPAMRNTIPEYHAITQAYVSAFNDTNSEPTKGDNLPPLINKQYMIKTMMSRLKRASEIEGKYVKHRAAVIVPICEPGKEKQWSASELEKLADEFCVESCNAARIRRFRGMFPEMKITKIQSAKVAPCLFKSQTRKTQIRTATDLGKIVAMFCVENEDQAYKRRIKSAKQEKYDNTWCTAIHPIYPHIGKADDTHDQGDQLDNACNVYSSVSKWVVLDSNICIADIDDDGLCVDNEVTEQAVASTTEKSNDKNGKVSRCLKSIRKLFKRKEK